MFKVDYSQCCVDAVLVPENELGQEHPVAHFANKLLERETQFSTMEGECYLL